jgi:RNA polymerase sigma-70 factor (ECF subfamily)
MTGQAITMAAAESPGEDPSLRLGVLFDAHHQRLYRLARRLAACADDARDLVQETFLRAARSPASIPEGAPHEAAWLVRVLINIARDRWRRNAVQRRGEPRQQCSGQRATNPESAAVAHATVWRALERLTPRRRAILVMYELEGMTIPAISTLLGVAAVTVRWHLSRGRHELAKVLNVPGSTR